MYLVADVHKSLIRVLKDALINARELVAAYHDAYRSTFLLAAVGYLVLLQCV